MNDRTLQFMQSQAMTVPGDHVICAVSGGMDSMALLHFLAENQQRLGIRVSAAHYNHHLRGAESDRDEAFVRDYCHAHGIPLMVDGADVAAYAAAQGRGTEDAARALRYAFFQEISKDAKLATAHTAEDNLETMLLRLVRGCDLRGLSAIPPIRGNIIRPLLMTPRREIQQYLTVHNIPHVEDSSNSSDDYLRNRMRHHVLPLLTAENPSLPAAASALCLRLGQEDAILSDLAQTHLQALTTPDGLSCPGLLSLKEAMALRVLHRYLSDVPEISSVQLSAALRLCRAESPSARLSLSGGYVLRRVYDRIQLTRGEASAAASMPLPAHGTVLFSGWEIQCQTGPCPAGTSDDTIVLPPSDQYILRPRQPGDRICLPGGTKKLSRFLIDKKVPAHQRDSLPVVVCGDTIAAVLPIQAARNYIPQQGCSSLILTVKRMENEV